MACVDDDVEHRPLPFSRYRLNMTAIPDVQLTPKQAAYSRVMEGRWRTENHYIPFKRTEWYPVGCTRTHAFAMLNVDGEYTPVVIELVYRNLVRPSQCMSSTKKFISPWTKYSDSFTNYLGGCAHDNNMCIVLGTSVIVMNSEWRVVLRDNNIALQKLVACTMNDKFLVIFGIETGKSVQSMFVYYLYDEMPRKVMYRHRIEPSVIQAHLLYNVPNAMLVQCENGRTRRICIEQSGPSAYSIKDVGDLKTGSAVDKPLVAKELYDSSHLCQLIGNDITVIKPGGIVERSFGMQHMIVDVIDYVHDLIVCQDAYNAVHFFDENLAKIASVPWEHIAAAVLLYEDGVSSILKPYSSLSRCVDDPTVVVMLASFGALVTIKML